jgi:hypothetical protein
VDNINKECYHWSPTNWKYLANRRGGAILCFCDKNQPEPDYHSLEGHTFATESDPHLADVDRDYKRNVYRSFDICISGDGVYQSVDDRFLNPPELAIDPSQWNGRTTVIGTYFFENCTDPDYFKPGHVCNFEEFTTIAGYFLSMNPSFSEPVFEILESVLVSDMAERETSAEEQTPTPLQCLPPPHSISFRARRIQSAPIFQLNIIQYPGWLLPRQAIYSVRVGF